LAETRSFDVVRIGLASPEEIRSWSGGEVKKPETINYRTFKPERDGLFCERIFGPTRDWECHCGKYKKIKFKGIICDRCGVEVTRAKVRRRRMGHIELASPVCHIWYLKGVPSPISLLLDLSSRPLEKVVYYASYIVTAVDRAAIERRMDDIVRAAEEEKTAILADREAAVRKLREQFEEAQQRQAQEQAVVDEVSEEQEPGPGEEDEDVEGLDDADADYFEEGLEEDFFTERPPMTEEDLVKRIQAEEESAAEAMRRIDDAVEKLREVTKKQLITEIEYRNIVNLLEVCEERLDGNFRDLIQAGLGAEAVRDLLKQIDLDELCAELRKEITETTGARRSRAVKRLKVAESFRKSKNRPEWMFLDGVPVLPPELRPMVQLDGGRFATSDLNDLYRRIINRNNRLKRIMEIKAPESIINHERRLLQEAVDALIDNSRRTRPVTGSNKRPLRSLSDMLKGKEGRFRKNLLGKRVDYSGRSVIVAGPELKLHECGLPREMALELFKPFVMKRLVEKGFTTNIKTAKRMVDRLKPEVWDALEEVIGEHPILLNRAPTLHRLGIQAFEPILIDGKAIQIHPLVCHAFNADFDGDQMAVHVPLSAHAQAEARLLMLAPQNLFKPADSSPICAPLYDIVLGCYYLTQERKGARGSGGVFANAEEAMLAYEHGRVDLHADIKVRLPVLELSAKSGRKVVEVEERAAQDIKRVLAAAWERGEAPARTAALIEVAGEDVEVRSLNGELAEGLAADLEAATRSAISRGRLPEVVSIEVAVRNRLCDTTVGRVILNRLIPLDLRRLDGEMSKGELAALTRRCFEAYGQERTVRMLDELKEMGFKFATRAGISISLADTDIHSDREQIIANAERQVEEANRQFHDGVIAAGERTQKIVTLWEEAREAVADAILGRIDRFNPIFMMANSGARAGRSHISQISGMRGLMADPFGRLIEDLPIKSNFHEGLNVLEYFVSTHGARKGLADTALRTADAGYLTRRLVDVAQDVIIRAKDCGTTNGIDVAVMYGDELKCAACGEEDLHRAGTCQHCGAPLPPSDDEIIESLRERIVGRVLAAPLVAPQTGEVLGDAGTMVTEEIAEAAEAAGIVSARIRSPLTCQLRQGICATCYGLDLATKRMVDEGVAVGIIAAQSIGEPGTQLTMRTFHTGGVAQQYLTGVAEVKKKKQEALRGLHEDIDRGLVALDDTTAERERVKAIQQMLKVLEEPVHGLLRVVELFEARKPKGQAIVSEVDGYVFDVETKGLRTVIIHSEQPLDDRASVRGQHVAEDVKAPGKRGQPLVEAGEKLTEKKLARLLSAGVKKVLIRKAYLVPHRGRVYVQKGQEVRAGDRLTDGPLDPQKVLAMKGIRGVQDYLMREIQKVYKSQGVDINDKHIETIVRQMLKKRRIIDHGDTDFLPGEVVDRFDFEAENRRVAELGGREATAEWVLLGITEASLATESFLSAASFQRTTRILAEAAAAGKRDHLLGLKENVIIGRLIPAGSGLPKLAATRVEPEPGAMPVGEPETLVSLLERAVEIPEPTFEWDSEEFFGSEMEFDESDDSED
jgi:DNA-directed RNA polymerase subunit beta'